jgi:transposase
MWWQGIMAAPRRVVELAIGSDDLARLEAIARSRSEPAIRVERARILLAYHANPSSVAVGQLVGVMRHTVLRCVRRAEQVGVLAALHDSPRPGKEPVITPEAKAWLVSLACRKRRTWLIRTKRGPRGCWRVTFGSMRRRHPCMAKIVQGTVCKILARHQVKPHKVRYYRNRPAGTAYRD